MANKSIQEINRILAALPPEHPAKGHHGLFLKARENLWGNIAIGLGNRLAIFQNKLPVPGPTPRPVAIPSGI